jgi:hypothetical protein
MLAKQVLSQLSYTPTAGLTLILEHFPIFCLSVFTFFAVTVHDSARCARPCTINTRAKSLKTKRAFCA